MAQAASVQIDGYNELRKELRLLEEPKVWTKGLSKSGRRIGAVIGAESRAEAQSMGGPFAHFAGAIQGTGGVTGAKVRIADPAANAAFWGAGGPTGWNPGPTPNQPPWVGNTWDLLNGDGPYAIAPTIQAKADWIVDETAKDIDDITRRAFPDN